jgi:LEA14-like dessication related protein
MQERLMHERLRRFALVVGLLVVSGASGCATAAQSMFTPPDVTFRGVGVRSVALDGAEFELQLHVFNPNAFGIDASRLRYRLLVDSVEVGAGALDSGFAIPKRDSFLVKLPVRIGFRAVQLVGPRLLRGGEIPYRVMGDVSLKSFVGTFTRNFNEAGLFDAFKTFRQ